MPILAVFSTLFMLLILYLNRKIAIVLNLTSCITDNFNDLIYKLRFNKQQADKIRDELDQNYSKRKTILKEIEKIRKE